MERLSVYCNLYLLVTPPPLTWLCCRTLFAYLLVLGHHVMASRHFGQDEDTEDPQDAFEGLMQVLAKRAYNFSNNSKLLKVG